jgi:hypothetical protein
MRFSSKQTAREGMTSSEDRGNFFFWQQAGATTTMNDVLSDLLWRSSSLQTEEIALALDHHFSVRVSVSSSLITIFCFFYGAALTNTPL